MMHFDIKHESCFYPLQKLLITFGLSYYYSNEKHLLIVCDFAAKFCVQFWLCFASKNKDLINYCKLSLIAVIPPPFLPSLKFQLTTLFLRAPSRA